MIDLIDCAIVAPTEFSKRELAALGILAGEVENRTQLRWPIRFRDASPGVPAIRFVRGCGPAEGYRIATEVGPPARLTVTASDERGLLFGVGHLLRKLHLDRGGVTLPGPLAVETAPRLPLRGHQLGYRPKPNSYDGWDPAMWRQYLRDLAVFGANAIELIPPRSDDEPDSQHFPLPQMRMMELMSEMADELGLDVWIWYPALDGDYSDPGTVAAALDEWAEVFRRLPRVDAVFVPGGDPGHSEPRRLLALLEKQAAGLRQHHPGAGMWVSPQGFDAAWMEQFLALLREEPEWLAGVVYGPQVRVPLAEFRRLVPERFPIRSYPDITHTRGCQYPVPDWDWPFQVTQGREPINPRPEAMARILRHELPHIRGFVTYSEGCNDDVNKMVWSALGWDPGADVREILRDYGRYFIGADYADQFAEALLGLEAAWRGPVEANARIPATLTRITELERAGSPRIRLNWRFQQANYRAHYDAYVQTRRRYEASLEDRALDALRQAGEAGTLAAIERAERILAEAETRPVAGDLRARVLELGEALYQSIRMQLSVEKYGALAIERGANLDTLDEPLNDRPWLLQRFAELRVMDESARADAIAALLARADPGPGGFYDDLGNLTRQPHLDRGPGFEADPALFSSPIVAVTERTHDGRELPRCQWTHVEGLYEGGVRLRYSGLDPAMRYRVRVLYGHYWKGGRVRLVANGRWEVHPFLRETLTPLDFPLPPEATASGELALEFQPEPGKGGNGHLLQIAEVWLLPVAAT